MRRATTIGLGALLLAGGALAAAALAAGHPRDARDAWRLARLERRVARIMRHLGLEDEDEPPADDEVRLLLRLGRRAEAIGRYRRAHGVGARAAEAAVAALE